MAKQSFTGVTGDLLASQGLTAPFTKSEILKINLTQLDKEVKIIKRAYRATLDAYFNGDKKLFDKAAEAWHNLGLVIQAHEIIISTYNELNRSIWK